MNRALACCLSAGTLLALTSAAFAGPDVIVGELPGTSKYGPDGNIYSYAVGTTSCNIGDDVLQWIDGTNQHPVITQNVLRLEFGRLTHLAMANPKHGFCALSGTVCGPCAATGCDTLGVGCSDPYSSGLNGSQGGLGPKSDVNPVTGFFNWPFTARNATGGSTYKRANVSTGDLQSSDANAKWFVASHYMTADEQAYGTQYNNESYRQVIPDSGGTWALNVTGPTERERYMIQAWGDNVPGVVEDIVDVPGDGRFIVAGNVTQNQDGTYRYTYCVQNYNSDRAMNGFTVPLPAGAVTANNSFFMPQYHSAEAWSNDPWNVTTTGTFTRWQMTNGSTNAGALRWDTMATFWFDANAAPTNGQVTLSLFKSGSPATVTADVPVPSIVGATGPINDPFTSPIAMSDGDSYIFDTTEATTDGSPDALCLGANDSDIKKDIWYTYTPDCDGDFTVSLCGSSFDTKLALYAGVPGGPDSAIACDDDGCGGLQSTLTHTGTGGTTYYIRVGGFTNASAVTAAGAGTISVTGPDCTGGIPANGADDCADAPQLPQGSVTFPVNTTAATTDGPVETGTDCDNAGTDQLGRDVWWLWTACADGEVTVDTCGSVSWDSRLAIYESCPSGPSQSIACNDDFDCDGSGGVANDGYRARVSFNALNGTTYLIRVGGYANANGTGSIALTSPTCDAGPQPPQNDMCPAAIGVQDPGIDFSTIDATTDGPSHVGCDQFGYNQVESDIWFNYPSQTTGTLTISTCPGTGNATADYDTKIAVYDGSGCVDLDSRLLACNDDGAGCTGNTSEVTINIVSGQNYYIRVGGYQGAQGTGYLALVSTSFTCPCDWNADGNLNDQDFFDWANDYFSQTGPTGQYDYNGDGFENDQDFFDFANCYFSPPVGCPGV